MHIHRPSGTHRIPNMVEYLDHLLARARQAMIFDRLAGVLDIERQMSVVPQQLRRLGQVDKTFDAGREQPLQPVLGLVARRPARMLARQQQPGNHPVAMSQGQLR
jgi:hypothetical protein